MEIHPAGDARRPFLRGAGGRAAILGAGVPRSTARPVGFPIWCLATSSAARDLAVTVREAARRSALTTARRIQWQRCWCSMLVLDRVVDPGGHSSLGNRGRTQPAALGIAQVLAKTVDDREFVGGG